MEEYQQGRRESSVISVQTVDSLSPDDRIAWRTIRKELEEVGVTVAAFEANRDFIFRWLTHAIKTGAFEEQNASEPGTHHISESQTASRDGTTNTPFNAPDINASTRIDADDEPQISAESSEFPSVPVPNVANNTQWTQPEVLSSAVSLPLEPIVACQRCDSPDQVRLTAAGFEALVLPDGYKKLLRAIVKNHVRDAKKILSEQEENPEEFQMDRVKGKGKGLSILLHGAPGVGKTATAECVAAQLNRPLLPITCGDISTNVRQAEEKLQEYCALAYRWRCVLLLDEADVFLAKREKNEMARNSLVSGQLIPLGLVHILNSYSLPQSP